MKARKPLTKREAAAIATAHLGPRGGVRIKRGARQIVEIKHVGDLVIHGEHPSSWRQAFAAAGIFDTHDNPLNP